MEVKNLTIVDHPLIRTRLAVIRQATTETAAFREALHDVARLMTFEVTRNLETQPLEVETPIKTMQADELKRPVVFVPILRAGIGLQNGFSDIVSESHVGYIGLYRDEETLEPKKYYCKLPDEIAEGDVFLIDPMLATGGSAIEAVSQLKKAGAKRIRFVCLIAAPEGVVEFHKAHPDVPIFTAALDECLNEKSYIVPGLGDAGDRYFGT
ncbi:UNVERIFIED_CONTAM: hypothetical protein GTU68_059724 [Idotea baltica]|nr:hypothetical protein [Idotea baltica]